MTKRTNKEKETECWTMARSHPGHTSAGGWATAAAIYALADMVAHMTIAVQDQVAATERMIRNGTKP